MIGHNSQTKVTLVNFSKKISFWSNIDPIWPKVRQLVLLLQRFLETLQYNGVQQLNISNISQFAKKIPFCSKGQFGQKLSNLIICSLRTFLKCCSKIELSRYTIVTVNFPRKQAIWTQLKPKLYETLYLISALRICLKYCRIMGAQQVGKSDVSQLSKTISFLGKMGNLEFGTTLANIFATINIMIHSNDLFQMLSSMIGHKR